MKGFNHWEEAIARGRQSAERLCGGVNLVSASEIRPEPISWRWEGWLAAGKLHILAGAPGTGKTTIAIAVAATMSCGGRWPDGTPAEQGDVLIWSGEDDTKDTLVPRLLACGADLSRVHFIGTVTAPEGDLRPFDPATDAAALLQEARGMTVRPKFLIVDPVVSAVAGDSHKNAEVRRALQPLVDLAQSLRCAVLGITHFTKGSNGRDPVERVTGSLAFGALPRIVMAAAKLPDDDESGASRLLARAKSNIGQDSGGFYYDLQPVEVQEYPGVYTTRLSWGAAVEGTARELLARSETDADPEERTAKEDAKGFLLELLADGPVPTKTVQVQVKEAGYSWATVRRAKDALGVKATRPRGGTDVPWYWALPDKGAQRCSPQKHEHLEQHEHLSENSPKNGDTGPTKVLNPDKGAQDAHVAQVGEGEHLRPKWEKPSLEVFEIPPDQTQKILGWLKSIGETDPEEFRATLRRCADDERARSYYLKRAANEQTQ